MKDDLRSQEQQNARLGKEIAKVGGEYSPCNFTKLLIEVFNQMAWNGLWALLYHSG